MGTARSSATSQRVNSTIRVTTAGTTPADPNGTIVNISSRLFAIPVAAAALALAACGTDDDASAADQPDTPVTSPVVDPPDTDTTDTDTTDTDTTAPDPGEFGDDFSTEQARDDARAVLGMYEEELPDDVRVGRRGDETFALTEDYVLGRRTVELDDTDGDGDGFRVTAVIVELPDGPETFDLEAG